MGYIDENGEWVDMGGNDPNENTLDTQGNVDNGASPSASAGYDPSVGTAIGDGMSPAQIAAFMRSMGVGTGGGGGGAPGAGGAGNPLSSLWKSLGLSGGGSGLDLMGLLGPILGAALSHHATTKATDQIVSGLHDASAQATDQIGGARGAFQPFIQGGQAAMAKAGAMNYAPLATQYKPLGSGRSLASFMGSK